MRRVHLLCAALLAAMFGVTLVAAPAHAQATRTWVSGVGDDANPCSRTAPCKTFAGAISKTAAGGEINCLDPGGFGGVTITKSITIDCSHTEGGVLVAGTNGVVVNAAATDIVTLRGLDIFGVLSSPALNGINFLNGAALNVEKCIIRQFKVQSPFPVGFGILFRPTGASELYVTDTYLTDNGAGSSGGAVMIRPTGSGSAKVTMNNVNANNNITGFTGDGSQSTGQTVFLLRDSVSAGTSFTGISAVTPAVGGGIVSIILDRSSVLNNITGVNSSGAKSFVTLSSAMIGGNTTGVSASGGGQILTFQNNAFVGNNVDGATTGNLMLK